MQDDAKKELDDLMQNYGASVDKQQSEIEKRKSLRENFNERFDALKHEIIWPVIVEVGNQINKFGNDYDVSENKASTDSTAVFHPANITVFIYPHTVSRAFFTSDTSPYISFQVDDALLKVNVVVSTLMPDGSGKTEIIAQFDLEQLTKEYVESLLVDVIKNTLLFHKEK